MKALKGYRSYWMFIKKIKLDTGTGKLAKKVIIILTVLFFLVSLSYALYVFPTSLSELKIQPMLMVMAFGVPAMVLLNSAQYWLSAAFNGKNPSLRDSVEITIIARAANMLPLPGGTIARVAALKSLGVSIRDGVSINLLLAFVWLGLSFIYSSVWMATIIESIYTLIFLGIGVCILLPTVIYLLYMSGKPKYVLLVLGTKTLMLIVDSAKILLCFYALDISANFAQASALSVSGVLGSAVSIVPAGLGIREAVASILAKMVGLSLSAGFLAVALNRILSMSVILAVSFYLSRRTLSASHTEQQ